MSRPNDKPAWASKIIHQMNVQQRDLIAMQRSLVRIEATVMAIHEATDTSMARARNNGHQVMANDRRTGTGNIPLQHSNSYRSMQHLVNRPAPNRSHSNHASLNDRPPPAIPEQNLLHRRSNVVEPLSSHRRSVAPEPLSSHRRSVVPSVPVANATRSSAQATPPPIALVAASIEMSMEMEENLLNLSDSE